jgi:hypothetical protein
VNGGSRSLPVPRRSARARNSRGNAIRQHRLACQADRMAGLDRGRVSGVGEMDVDASTPFRGLIIGAPIAAAMWVGILAAAARLF